MQEPDRDLIPEAIAIQRGMVYRKNAKGFICEAYQPTPFLIDVLLEKRIINADHHFYGVQMMTMRKLFLRDVAVKVGMLRVKSEEGAAQDKPIPMDDTDYLKVLRNMRTPYFRDTVVAICVEDAETHSRYHGQHVPMAFDQLAKAVQTLWEAKRQNQENIGDDERFR